MLSGKIGLEHQRTVEILLVEVVELVAILGIELVHRGGTHEGNVGAMLLVEDKGMLHIALVAVGVEFDAIKFVLMGG